MFNITGVEGAGPCRHCEAAKPTKQSRGGESGMWFRRLDCFAFGSQ
jgi:hypothetical protein